MEKKFRIKSIRRETKDKIEYIEDFTDCIITVEEIDNIFENEIYVHKESGREVIIYEIDRKNVGVYESVTNESIGVMPYSRFCNDYCYLKDKIMPNAEKQSPAEMTKEIFKIQAELNKPKEASKLTETKGCIRCGHEGFWFSRCYADDGLIKGDVCKQCGQIQSQPVKLEYKPKENVLSDLELIVIELEKENHRLKEENKTKPSWDLKWYLKLSMKGMVHIDKVLEVFDNSIIKFVFEENVTCGDLRIIRQAIENMEKK